MIPGRIELGIMAVVAVVCAVVVTQWTEPRTWLAVVVFPMILSAMLMGARRTGKLSAQREEAEDEVEETV